MIYGRKWHEYAKQWDTMMINASRRSEAERAAQYAVDHKDTYFQIEHDTGVPWPMVACDHRRESDRQDSQGNPLFNTYLGNGQALWQKTTIVPLNRGPFIRQDDAGRDANALMKAFITGAKDAYAIDKLDRVRDWQLEKILYYSELFNGAGYDLRGLPSPYLWGGTNQQKPGKFISDHRFNAQAIDKQLGIAPILWCIAHIDNTVVYERETS